MKQTYILIFAVVLIGCNQSVRVTNIRKVIQDPAIISGSLNKNKPDERKPLADDSLVSYDDNLFADLELSFHVISAKEFQSYKRKYRINCTLDSGQFISGSGLFVNSNCNEICETYLVEKATKRKMLIPSGYDTGILNMLLSQTCTQLLVCSSYDGQDFENYYQHRAEFYVFNISKEAGLNGIKPASKFYAKDWSIADFTWVNDKTIALKVYEGNGSDVDYSYLKTQLYH